MQLCLPVFHPRWLHKLGSPIGTPFFCQAVQNSCDDDATTQGAAEIVLRRCTAVMGPEGNAVPLVPELKALLEETVTNMASTGLRTLCLTYR